MNAVSKTHVGMKRKINEDSFYVSPKEFDGFFAIVADGMGGHQAGEIASTVAVEKISTFICENYSKDMSTTEAEDILKRSINSANWEIYNEAVKNQKMKGMGTTASVVMHHENQYIIAHVGDSRIYSIFPDNGEEIEQREKIKQITKDHSFVYALMEQGYITAEEARVHPQKNIITRAVGASVGITVDSFICPDNGQYMLICSDGLTNYLDDKQLYNIISSKKDDDILADFEKKTNALVHTANQLGGADNITVILINNEKNI